MKGSYPMSDLASESDAPLRIVDFHNHFVGPSFTLRTLARVPQAKRAFGEDVNRQLTDRTALISSIEGSGIGARVISTPMEFIADADGAVAPDIVPRINDAVAALVGQYPGRLYPLATVDAYSGEAGALELTRAVKELGLRPVFVDTPQRALFTDPRA